MMKNEKLLIIGNGRSVLNYKLQNRIDSFPLVARINNYKIKKYEKFIGSKTDLWINGGNQNLKTPTLLPKKILVFIPSVVQQKKTQNNLKNKFGISNFEIIDIDSIKNIENKVNSNRLTTGITSIIWATKNYKEVFIHGFDYFIKSKSHYYDPYISEWINYFLRKGHKHNLIKEKKFITNLLINKKIKLFYEE